MMGFDNGLTLHNGQQPRIDSMSVKNFMATYIVMCKISKLGIIKFKTLKTVR